MRRRYSVMRNLVTDVNEFLTAVAKFVNVFGVRGLYRLPARHFGPQKILVS